ncbi:hypothetical protein DFH07DRAFT_1010891 [Mycena maculata]|uniref:Uncharacterized protein n=1 Tax=Mycena maculata TaxID=230809 RepID=A0AAD7P009_9AGAR|nr:hypothetical protein DFH07DRAFT_1010891 [Mycena maculata]
MNSQNPSHYQEHTRQQDGWTVLAPPESELPPPYTPDAELAAATAPAAAAPQGPTLAFDIPINSNIIGAAPVTRSKNFGREVPFSTAYVEICNMMGLDPADACLSYKWENDKVNAPNCQLANTANWDNCLQNGIGMTTRARVRKVICVIKNLNLPTETVPAATTHAASGAKSTGTKRKSASASENSASGRKRTFDFMREFHELQAHLRGENSNTNIRYPPITNILQLIDDSGIFEDSPDLTFPAIIFVDVLHELQVTHVNQVLLLEADFYVHQTNMPVQLAELFVEESITAIGRAHKGKGTALN